MIPLRTDNDVQDQGIDMDSNRLSLRVLSTYRCPVALRTDGFGSPDGAVPDDRSSAADHLSCSVFRDRQDGGVCTQPKKDD